MTRWFVGVRHCPGSSLRSIRTIVPLHRIAPLAAALMLVAPVTAHAQGGAPPRPGPGVVVGVVVDTVGRAIDSVSVFIESRTRETFTATDGTFRFNAVRFDTVTVVALREGYYPQSRRVTVGKDGGSVLFELVPRLATLPAAITEATLSGLRGVVSDTSFNAVAGVEVSALGGTAGIVTTDSSGAFFIDVNPGHYMVRVKRDGYVEQMIGVTIPPTGGRRIAVRLTPGIDPYHARVAAYAVELKDRLLTRSPVWSKIFTREDIAKFNLTETSQLATFGIAQRVDGECWAIVNGGLSQMPLWAIDPEEIEMMEVYVRPVGAPLTGGTTSINGNQSIATQRNQAARASSLSALTSCPAQLFIWTRK